MMQPHFEHGHEHPGQTRVVAGPLDNAVDVVRMRYAKGEIDRDDFLRISADLGGAPEPPPVPSG